MIKYHYLVSKKKKSQEARDEKHPKTKIKLNPKEKW